jgi:GMP synthase-like glutamine amidotransferase
MRVLAIRHHDIDTVGFIGEAFEARGASLAVHLFPDEGPLPALDGVDYVIVFGAVSSVNDPDPWIAEEVTWLREADRAGVPVLGICFGAQVLARVLGARLYRLPVPEIGWAKVTSEHPGLPEGPWLSWHRDAFDLPPGAKQIAANAVCVQGFSLGPHTGLQFHPEATQQIAASWLRFAAPPPGEEVTGPLFRDSGGAWDRAAVHARALFSAWLDGGLAGPPA